MYFSHHYAIDLVEGSLCKSVTVMRCLLFLIIAVAGIAYFWTRANSLPRVQLDKRFRWDYDYVETGDPQDTCYSIVDTRELFSQQLEYDSWTNGYSFPYSICGRSPTGARSSVDEPQSLGESDIVGSNTGPSR
jgi:hypothetical protein